MISQRSGQRTTTPAQPLMDFEAGKGDPRKMIWAVGLSALGIAIILPLGAALAIACRPPLYGEWSGWAILGHVVGWGLGILGIVVAAVPMADYLTDAAQHRARQREAFALELALREQSGGLIVHEEYEEFCFYADRPNDMLMLVLALTRRKQRDPHFRPSIASLIDEGVWLGNRKLGNVNTSQARKILADLSEQGFIIGRGEGATGEWVYTDLEAAIDRYERKAG